MAFIFRWFQNQLRSKESAPKPIKDKLEQTPNEYLREALKLILPDLIILNRRYRDIDRIQDPRKLEQIGNYLSNPYLFELNGEVYAIDIVGIDPNDQECQIKVVRVTEEQDSESLFRHAQSNTILISFSGSRIIGFLNVNQLELSFPYSNLSELNLDSARRYLDLSLEERANIAPVDQILYMSQVNFILAKNNLMDSGEQ
jgi:hypothetical protein